MKRAFKISLLVTIALLLQSCTGMDRVKMVKALDASNIEQFKTEVSRIQTDPGYNAESRAEGLYDALLLAAGRDKEATLYLLEQGVPIDSPENQPNSTKRGLALTSAVEKYQPEIVRLLLEHGANPNIELWSIDPRNNILYISFMHRDLVISRILLEHGANPNQWSNPVYSSLLGIYSGEPKIQKLLKEYGGVNDPTPEQRAGTGVTIITKPQTHSTKSQKLNKNSAAISERLKELSKLRDQGLISQEEYSQARAKILAEL